MSRRERLETALRGGQPDRIPFTIYKWLIPASPGAQALQDEGLTPIDAANLYESRTRGCTIESHDTTENGKRATLRRFVTPVGDLHETIHYDPSFGSPWIVRHRIETAEDMDVVRYIVEHTEFTPTPDDFVRRDREIADSGIVLGLLPPVPIAQMWVEFMGTEKWSELLMTDEDRFDALHDALLALYKRQVDLAAQSPAEFIWLPDNVTAVVISPTVFEKYCLPAYDYVCSVLRRAGKRSFSHYDGATGPLRPLIAKTGIDILEALTPPPMGDTTVADARTAWPGKVLSLNFPGCLFREPDDVIESHAATFLREAARTDHFILGCTEEFDFSHFDRAFSAISRILRRFDTP